MTLTFRQPPSNRQVFTAAIVFIPLLFVAALVPIAWTFDTAWEDTGLGIAVALTLLIGAGLFATLYGMMTPMTIAVGRDGLTLTNQRTGQSRMLGWDAFTYSLIEGTSERVLLLHDDGRTFAIKEHPVYAKSPPEFSEVCDVIVEKGRAR
jgi:hypothetical protein